MGEWSEYFEGFPEENSANYDKNGNYDPNNKLRDNQEKLDIANQKLNEVLIKKKKNN